MSSSSTREVVKEVPTAAGKVWRLPSVEKTFISVVAQWFGKYITDMFSTVRDCYVRRVMVE